MKMPTDLREVWVSDPHLIDLLARQRVRTRKACDALECLRAIVALDRDKQVKQSAEWRRYNVAIEIADKAIAESRVVPQ